MDSISSNLFCPGLNPVCCVAGEDDVDVVCIPEAIPDVDDFLNRSIPYDIMVGSEDHLWSSKAIDKR